VQTIPSLALLALLVPLPFFGISIRTAIAALFLYGLLPIVRNTATGLQEYSTIIARIRSRAGTQPIARLWEVYLPMASRSILSGIKTSAVINIGTATLAALIGAGGLGEPIISGLDFERSRDHSRGCDPSAVLALLVQWCFDCLIAFSFQKDFVYRVARASGVLSQAEKLALHLINANRFYQSATGEKVKSFLLLMMRKSRNG